MRMIIIIMTGINVINNVWKMQSAIKTLDMSTFAENVLLACLVQSKNRKKIFGDNRRKLCLIPLITNS
jgi:hypothetical protein